MEIVWIYRPLGVPIGARADHGLNLIMREGRLDEVRSALELVSSGKKNIASYLSWSLGNC